MRGRPATVGSAGWAWDTAGQHGSSRGGGMRGEGPMKGMSTLDRPWAPPMHQRNELMVEKKGVMIWLKV